MNIIQSFNNAFERQKERGWKYIYIFVDIHGTVFHSDYGNKEKIYNFYPYSKKVLQYLSKRKDIKLGLFTCSYANEIAEYLDVFEENNIMFDFINRNEDEHNTSYGNFKNKTYFNVLLDDKAGFDPASDWECIFKFFEELDNQVNEINIEFEDLDKYHDFSYPIIDIKAKNNNMKTEKNNTWNTKYPYKCVIKNTGDKFIPIMIDYDNKQIWRQNGQASENGEWIDFDNVEFFKNRNFIDLTEIK